MEPRHSERDEFFDAIENEIDLNVLRIESITRKSTFFTEPRHKSVDFEESSSSSDSLLDPGFSQVSLNKFASVDFSTAASAHSKSINEAPIVISIPEWSEQIQKNSKEVVEYAKLKLIQELP